MVEGVAFKLGLCCINCREQGVFVAVGEVLPGKLRAQGGTDFETFGEVPGHEELGSVCGLMEQHRTRCAVGGKHAE